MNLYTWMNIPLSFSGFFFIINQPQLQRIYTFYNRDFQESQPYQVNMLGELINSKLYEYFTEGNLITAYLSNVWLRMLQNHFHSISSAWIKVLIMKYKICLVWVKLGLPLFHQNPTCPVDNKNSINYVIHIVVFCIFHSFQPELIIRFINIIPRAPYTYIAIQ